MPVNARHYRDELYRNRAHPEISPGFIDRRNSYSVVYLSLIPFLGLEYFAESSFDVIPAGLMFPMAYLLFWAFFYTYYKPGFLEESLTAPEKWDLMAIPTVIMGVALWFVKVTVVEFSSFLIRQFSAERKPNPSRSRPNHARPSGARESSQGTGSYHHSGSYDRSTGGEAKMGRAGAGPHHQPSGSRPTGPKVPPSQLPKDVLHALSILGLAEGVDWSQIHRRYRGLAKQFHPDLNHDITSAGRRFMMVDAAYKKLGSVRHKYFIDKKA